LPGLDRQAGIVATREKTQPREPARSIGGRATVFVDRLLASARRVRFRCGESGFGSGSDYAPLFFGDGGIESRFRR
jgi:hypothetical protein